MQRRRRPTGTTFATLAAMAVVGAGLLVFLVLRLAESDTVKSQLGNRIFEAGRAADLYHEIITPDDRGRSGPILLQALVGNHDIYIQHLGRDPQTGWTSFEAHSPGAPRTCVLTWRAATSDFLDGCDGRTYPGDGSGLRHYNTTVNASHRVVIDLQAQTARRDASPAPS